MQTAARVAYTFHLDPVLVLAETDTLRRQLREASVVVWAHDQEAVTDG